MAELHVRNLSPELHARLRQRAAAEGRSMAAEAIVLLRNALQPGDDPHSQQRAALDRLEQIRQRSRSSTDVPLSEQLVREDRDLAG